MKMNHQPLKEPARRHNQILGRWGEEVAAAFLERHGYKVLAKNVRTPEGEIDLIAEFNGELIFCEVKTRKDNLKGFPEEAVTDEKMDHMMDSAECYLSENLQYGENWRVDVISVTGNMNDPNPQIEWFENAL